MTDALYSFLNTAGSSILTFVAYAVAFIAMSLFLLENKDNKAEKPKNFSAINPKKPYIHKEFWLDCKFFLFNALITDFGVKFVVFMLTVFFLLPLAPYQMFDEQIQQWPVIARVLFALIIYDFAVFVPHLIMHKFFWEFHSIHHAPEEMTWGTAFRVHPFDHILNVMFSTIMLHFLGFQGTVIFLTLTCHGVYNVFTHANIYLSFPKPLRYILASPNYHHWHHAAADEAVDKNLVVMFPVWDIIFGTYYYPDGKPPEAYGVNDPDDRANYPKTFLGQLLYPFKKKDK